jgi:hypothetical protein
MQPPRAAARDALELAVLVERITSRVTCARPILARQLFMLGVAVSNGEDLPDTLKRRLSSYISAQHARQRRQILIPKERARIVAMVNEEHKRGARLTRDEAFKAVSIRLRTIPGDHHRGQGSSARHVETIYQHYNKSVRKSAGK